MSRATEIKTEQMQDKTGVENKKSMPSHTKREMNKELLDIQHNSQLSRLDKLEKSFNIVSKYADSMHSDQLDEKLYGYLVEHQQLQPDRNTKRDNMVKQYKELTGKNIPIASNDNTNGSGGNLKNILNEAGSSLDLSEMPRDNISSYKNSSDYAMA